MRHILAIIACLFVASVAAQEYPVRPVRLIVPIGPGGGTDILGRHMAQKMSERMRAAVVVENRPGAGSIIGTDYVAKSAPDGYTLLVGGIFNMVMNKALVKDLSYEPTRDFMPLGYISAYPFALVARADLPPDLAGFVQYAKDRPGKLTYGSAGLGTLQHVWGTILVRMLGLDMVHVPFKAAPARRRFRGRELVRALRAGCHAGADRFPAARCRRGGAPRPGLQRAGRQGWRPRARRRSRRSGEVPAERSRPLERARYPPQRQG